MAFTVGSYGLGSLSSLVKLIGTFYLTSIVFVVAILGSIAALTGFSIFRFIAYIKDELLIVLGTSSSETVLPDMMQKLERLGASRSIVGLVFPTGYSFNTDGTNIYLTLAVIFLAQATNTHLAARADSRNFIICHDRFEGCFRSYRHRIRYLGGNSYGGAVHPYPGVGNFGGHRQIHERMSRAD